jgi:hypothetical protein
MILEDHRAAGARDWLPAKLDRRRLAAMFLLCILLGACGEGSEQKQLLSDKKSFITLAVGIEMMLDRWRSDELPDQFVSRALPNAGDALGRQAGQITAEMIRAKSDEPAVTQAMRAVLSATIAANASVEKSDRFAAGIALKDLRDAMAQLRAIDVR